MWLDMQGYELNALKSSDNILGTTKAIFTEVALKELYNGAPLYEELKSWLESKDFVLKIEKLSYEDYGDALFVRP
jgi:hypothetical protein